MPKYKIKPQTNKVGIGTDNGSDYNTAFDPERTAITPIGAIGAYAGDMIWSPAATINEYISASEVYIRLKNDTTSNVDNFAVGDILLACPGAGQTLAAGNTADAIEYMYVEAVAPALRPNQIKVVRAWGLGSGLTAKAFSAGSTLMKVGKAVSGEMNCKYSFMWMDSASDTLKVITTETYWIPGFFSGFRTDKSMFDAGSVVGSFGDPDGQGVKLVAAVIGTSMDMVDGSPSGPGVLINSAGIKGYNSSSENTFSLDAATGLADFAGATPHTVPGQLQVGPSGSGILVDGVNTLIKSNNYVEKTSGFLISPDLIEATNLRARGSLECVTFKYDAISSIGGTFLIAPSGELMVDMDAGDYYLVVENDIFAAGDYVVIKPGATYECVHILDTGAVGGGGYYYYSVLRAAGNNGGDNSFDTFAFAEDDNAFCHSVPAVYKLYEAITDSATTLKLKGNRTSLTTGTYLYLCDGALKAEFVTTSGSGSYTAGGDYTTFTIVRNSTVHHNVGLNWKKGVCAVRYSHLTTGAPSIQMITNGADPKIQLNTKSDATFGSYTNLVEIAGTGISIKKGGDISLEYDVSDPAEIKFKDGSGNVDYKIMYTGDGGDAFYIGNEAGTSRIGFIITGGNNGLAISSDIITINGTTLGFYGVTPYPRQTLSGTVTAAQIAQALENLGLIIYSP